jgi:hypothetical protein
LNKIKNLCLTLAPPGLGPATLGPSPLPVVVALAETVIFLFLFYFLYKRLKNLGKEIKLNIAKND